MIYEQEHLDYHLLWANHTGGIQVFPLGSGEYKVVFFTIDEDGVCHNMDLARYHTPVNLLKLINKENLHPTFKQFKLVEAGHGLETDRSNQL